MANPPFTDSVKNTKAGNFVVARCYHYVITSHYHYARIAFLKKFGCHSPMVGQISEKNGTKTGRRRDDHVAKGHGEGGQRMEIEQRQQDICVFFTNTHI